MELPIALSPSPITCAISRNACITGLYDALTSVESLISVIPPPQTQPTLKSASLLGGAFLTFFCPGKARSGLTPRSRDSHLSVCTTLLLHFVWKKLCARSSVKYNATHIRYYIWRATRRDHLPNHDCCIGSAHVYYIHKHGHDRPVFLLLSYGDPSQTGTRYLSRKRIHNYKEEATSSALPIWQFLLVHTGSICVNMVCVMERLR